MEAYENDSHRLPHISYFLYLCCNVSAHTQPAQFVRFETRKHLKVNQLADYQYFNVSILRKTKNIFLFCFLFVSFYIYLTKQLQQMIEVVVVLIGLLEMVLWFNHSTILNNIKKRSLQTNVILAFGNSERYVVIKNTMYYSLHLLLITSFIYLIIF